MAVEFVEHNGGRSVEVVARGKLTAEDYQEFVPRFDGLIDKYGGINVLFIMIDFGGFELWALWEDIKMDWERYTSIERLGMVGEESWEEWMHRFCKPFTSAESKYFDAEYTEQAREWVINGSESG